MWYIIFFNYNKIFNLNLKNFLFLGYNSKI